MNKIIVIAALLGFIPSSHSNACSIFASPFAGDSGVAHNVDWFRPYPGIRGVLTVNPPQLKKRGELLGAKVEPAQWTSKWGSLTFSIAGVEFPVSGFNERGLTMGVLQLPEAQYPALEDPRPALGAGQFVQYSLDLFETIEEVIASNQLLRPYSFAKMHFFACDSSRKCVVLQYLKGELNVFRDGDMRYQALTNSNYRKSLEAGDACLASASSCQAGDSSLARFARVARLRKEMSAAAPFSGQAFGVLNEVAQTGDDGLTRFQVVYNAKNQAVQVRKFGSENSGELKVDFTKLDCREPRKVIFVNAESKGDLSGSWEPLTEANQTDMVLQMGYPVVAARAYGKFPFESVSCHQR